MKNKSTVRVQWALAVTEGRVVRFENGLTFRSFPTIAARDAFLAKLEPGQATIVRETV